MSEYVVGVWNSQYVRRQIEQSAKTTSGIWKINQSHLGMLNLPVPSLPEQERRLRRARVLKDAVRQARELDRVAVGEVRAVVPSVLRTAFAGEL